VGADDERDEQSESQRPARSGLRPARSIAGHKENAGPTNRTGVLNFTRAELPSRLGPFAILGSQPPLGRGTLELPGFAGLHVVTTASQVLQNASTLHLLFEDAERDFDTVAFAKVNFDHLGYRPILTTFSAAGTF
jgi:hypothetical protein